MENRLRWVDIAKGISILIVVGAHCYSEYSNAYDSILNVAGSIHNPIFYFCSGTLFALQEKNYKAQGKKFIIKKLCDLLIPFLVWVIIYTGVGMRVLGYNIVGAAVNAMNQLWFLPVLFIASCSVFLIFRTKCSKMIIGGIIVGIFVGGFVSSLVAKIFAYVLVVLIGYGVQKNIMQTKRVCLCALVFWIVFTIIVILPARLTLEDAIRPGIELLLILLYNIAGGIGITYIVRRVEGKFKCFPKALMYLGRNSLYIYILHYAVIYIAKYLEINKIWQLGMVFLISICVSLLWIRVMRNKLIDKIFFKPSLLCRKKGYKVN